MWISTRKIPRGETAEACAAEVREGSLRNFLREYLEKQKMVSPDDSWE